MAFAEFLYHLPQFVVLSAEALDLAAKMVDNFAAGHWRTFRTRAAGADIRSAPFRRTSGKGTARASIGVAPIGWALRTRAARGSLRAAHVGRAGGAFADHPIDLLGDLFGLVMEPGGVEIVHGDAEMIESCFQLRRRTRPVSFSRCAEPSVQLLKLTFQLLGPFVLTGLMEFLNFTFHLSESFHSLARPPRAGTFPIARTRETFVKLAHLLL